MRLGGKGGANTATGLKFERKTDLIQLLSKIEGYRIESNIWKAGTQVLFRRGRHKLERTNFQ